MNVHKIFSMAVAVVYPLYVTKIEKKGRTVAELNPMVHQITRSPAQFPLLPLGRMELPSVGVPCADLPDNAKSSLLNACERG